MATLTATRHGADTRCSRFLVTSRSGRRARRSPGAVAAARRPACRGSTPSRRTPPGAVPLVVDPQAAADGRVARFPRPGQCHHRAPTTPSNSGWTMASSGRLRRGLDSLGRLDRRDQINIFYDVVEPDRPEHLLQHRLTGSAVRHQLLAGLNNVILDTANALIVPERRNQLGLGFLPPLPFGPP